MAFDKGNLSSSTILWRQCQNLVFSFFIFIPLLNFKYMSTSLSWGYRSQNSIATCLISTNIVWFIWFISCCQGHLSIFWCVIGGKDFVLIFTKSFASYLLKNFLVLLISNMKSGSCLTRSVHLINSFFLFCRKMAVAKTTIVI